MILAGETLDGIMLGLIGWFLGASSRSVDRWVVMDGLIADVRVGEAMEAELDTIAPQLTLDTFAPQVLDGTLGPACRCSAARSSSGSSARASCAACRGATGPRRGRRR